MFNDRLIFEPMNRIRNTFYRCDSQFHIDELVSMYSKEYDINCVIYTDGNECCWYELKNRNFKRVAHRDINLQSQFKGGGQSANRHARNIEIQRDQYILMMAEKTVELFYDKEENC